MLKNEERGTDLLRLGPRIDIESTSSRYLIKHLRPQPSRSECSVGSAKSGGTVIPLTQQLNYWSLASLSFIVYVYADQLLVGSVALRPAIPSPSTPQPLHSSTQFSRYGTSRPASSPLHGNGDLWRPTAPRGLTLCNFRAGALRWALHTVDLAQSCNRPRLGL